MSEYSSVTNFLEVEAVPPGILTIHSGGVPIDLLVSPGSSNTTIFFFHGAIEHGFTLPVLSGLGISGGLDANRVFVSDPSLTFDNSLMLAWYAGNHQQPDLQQTLVSIFKKIADGLGSDRTVFFGGSGGGFASLYFASHFRNSLALVFNPQTNIAMYSERAVRGFAEKAFSVPPGRDSPLDELPPQVIVDLCQIYNEPRDTIIAYLQNSNDASHVERHLRPFTKAIHPQTEFLLLNQPWLDGHSPPPKDLLARLLNLVTSSDSWRHELTDIGFTDLTGHFTEN